VLRQLAARVGEQALRAGLRRYFVRHAYGTATFADFLAALSEAAGADMTAWAAAWFAQANVNTLYPQIAVADGRISAAAIRQTAPHTHPVLRPHTLDVGLYDRHGAGTVFRVEVEAGAERTELPELAGQPAPKLLLLNDGDLTYAKIRFDPRSRAALPEMLPRLSPGNRAMVWCSLLMAVQDGAFPAVGHLELVTRMIAVESELSIVTEVLEQARNDVADRFLDPWWRAVAMSRVAEALRHRLGRTRPGEEWQITLFRALVEFTASVTDLRDWLGGCGLPAGLTVDADLAWRMRYRLAVLGGIGDREITVAYDASPDGHGLQSSAKCRAARPDPAAKKSTWDSIMTDTSLSSYGLWALAEGFWQPEQVDLTAPYVARFFADMPAAARLRGDLALDTLVRFLYPRYAATRETLVMAEGLLAREDIPLPLRRRVADLTDDLRRVVAVRRPTS